MNAIDPSEWYGNYTCYDDMVTVHFIMNFTHSKDTIGLLGDMTIDSHLVKTNGSFASAFRTLTLQTPHVILDEINGRNFTKVELNAYANSTVYIEGVIIFSTASGTNECPLELRRHRRKFFSVFLFRIIAASAMSLSVSSVLSSACKTFKIISIK